MGREAEVGPQRPAPSVGSTCRAAKPAAGLLHMLDGCLPRGGGRLPLPYDERMSSLLLVCTANVCRSPMAEVVFRAQAYALGLSQVASAGTHAHPRGQAMDKRAVAALEQRRYQPDKRWRSRRI